LGALPSQLQQRLIHIEAVHVVAQVRPNDALGPGSTTDIGNIQSMVGQADISANAQYGVAQ